MDIAAEIDAIAEQYAPVAPESAHKLLLLCACIYIAAPFEDVYCNYLDGATAIFREWYVQQPKFDEAEVEEYPIPIGFSACTCGKVLGNSYGLLYHCYYCKGHQNIARFVDAYTIQRLSLIFDINQYYLESVFAKAIAIMSSVGA